MSILYKSEPIILPANVEVDSLTVYLGGEHQWYWFLVENDDLLVLYWQCKVCKLVVIATGVCTYVEEGCKR